MSAPKKASAGVPKLTAYTADVGKVITYATWSGQFRSLELTESTPPLPARCMPRSREPAACVNSATRPRYP
jgi:hypothetical protein